MKRLQKNLCLRVYSIHNFSKRGALILNCLHKTKKATMQTMCLIIVFAIFLTQCMCCNMSHRNCPCRFWECQPHCDYKRSVQDDETDIFTDLCNFNTYDIDENGEISKDELLAITGRSDESQRLFLSLDNEKEDGVITLIEFTAAAPKYIKGCKESDKDN